jgi:hypothetical protein
MKTMKKAQMGKTVKSSKTVVKPIKKVSNSTISKKPGTMLIPGMGMSTGAPKKVETSMAKSGTNLKKKK